MSKKSIKSDLARIDRMKEADIDYSDIPALGKTFLKKATTAWPPAKRPLTIRLEGARSRDNCCTSVIFKVGVSVGTQIWSYVG